MFNQRKGFGLVHGVGLGLASILAVAGGALAFMRLRGGNKRNAVATTRRKGKRSAKKVSRPNHATNHARANT
jgi:hypothetical protein